MNDFYLSSRSRSRLKGVHPHLINIVECAIQITEVDFTVLEGLRTESRQRHLVSIGASKTFDSRHLTGHAVDLGAWVTGGVRWDWPLYDLIAEAVWRASKDSGTPVVWGGAWGRLLTDFGSAAEAKDSYIDSRRSIGKRPFLDGPHYELPRGKYV